MLVKNNDMHMVIYLSSLIRCIIALHDLVVNKIAYNDEVGDGLENKVKEKKAAIKGGGNAGEEKKEDDGASFGILLMRHTLRRTKNILCAR